VTATTPTQGTVCNPDAKQSPGMQGDIAIVITTPNFTPIGLGIMEL